MKDYTGKIILGDAKELTKDIPDNSIDMILTDPPYPKKYHHLYKWLAIEGKRVLKENSFLFAYAGPYWKNVVMKYLGAELNYYYDFILRHKGNTSILWPRKIISGYKSILCYQKGTKGLPFTNVLGFITGTGGDKRFHRWGQEENTVRYFIETFTKEDWVIWDPFCGGGTIPMVCKTLNRKFIAFDEDEESIKISTERLGGIIPGKTPSQMTLQI